MSFCRSNEDKFAFIQNLYKWSTKQGDSLSHLSAKNRVQQQQHLCLCKWSLACSQTENVEMYFKLSQLYPELRPGSTWAEEVRKEGAGNWQQRTVAFCQALYMVLMWMSYLLRNLYSWGSVINQNEFPPRLLKKKPKITKTISISDTDRCELPRNQLEAQIVQSGLCS